MSVSLEEVLNGVGYHLNNVDDCEWLLGKVDEFEELVEKAQDLVDQYEDYLDCRETAEDDGDYGYPSFQEWRKIKMEEQERREKESL